MSRGGQAGTEHSVRSPTCQARRRESSAPSCPTAGPALRASLLPRPLRKVGWHCPRGAATPLLPRPCAYQVCTRLHPRGPDPSSPVAFGSPLMPSILCAPSPLLSTPFPSPSPLQHPPSSPASHSVPLSLPVLSLKQLLFPSEEDSGAGPPQEGDGVPGGGPLSPTQTHTQEIREKLLSLEETMKQLEVVAWERGAGQRGGWG